MIVIANVRSVLTSEVPSLSRFHEVVERTVAAGSARIRVHVDFSGLREAYANAPVRRGNVVSRVLLKGLRAITPSTLDGSGVLDIAGRRAAFGNDSFAVLQLDGTIRAGRPGRDVTGDDPVDNERIVPLLHLVDALTTATGLRDHGVEDVDGRPCRHVTLTENATDGVVEAWLDDTHVRRVHSSGERWDAITVTLDAHGVDLGDVDWTRLPEPSSGHRAD